MKKIFGLAWSSYIKGNYTLYLSQLLSQCFLVPNHKELYKKRLAIDNPKGTVKINGENLNIALEGEFVGGVFKHIGSIDIREKEKDFELIIYFSIF